MTSILLNFGFTLLLTFIILPASFGAENIIKLAKASVENILTDPFSAKFKNVESFADGVVCGQVNAKNKMGGYVGFKDFIYNGISNGVELDVTSNDVALWCNNRTQKRGVYAIRLRQIPIIREIDAKQEELNASEQRASTLIKLCKETISESERIPYCESITVAENNRNVNTAQLDILKSQLIDMEVEINKLRENGARKSSKK